MPAPFRQAGASARSPGVSEFSMRAARSTIAICFAMKQEDPAGFDPTADPGPFSVDDDEARETHVRYAKIRPVRSGLAS